MFDFKLKKFHQCLLTPFIWKIKNTSFAGNFRRPRFGLFHLHWCRRINYHKIMPTDSLSSLNKLFQGVFAEKRICFKGKYKLQTREHCNDLNHLAWGLKTLSKNFIIYLKTVDGKISIARLGCGEKTHNAILLSCKKNKNIGTQVCHYRYTSLPIIGTQVC